MFKKSYPKYKLFNIKCFILVRLYHHHFNFLFSFWLSFVVEGRQISVTVFEIVLFWFITAQFYFQHQLLEIKLFIICKWLNCTSVISYNLFSSTYSNLWRKKMSNYRISNIIILINLLSWTDAFVFLWDYMTQRIKLIYFIV